MSRCTLQKERALKVTLQVALEAAAGAESAVYDCLVIRLHASYTKHENAAYCYRHSVVCVCVLDTAESPTKTTKQIEVSFGTWNRNQGTVY